MKTFSNPIKCLALTLLILLTALVIGTGCNSLRTASDPLTGWHAASKNPDQSIVDDYQNYIHTLSPEEQKFVAYIICFEDGSGQYAVKITIGLNHTNWEHVLIYDKNNKRIKVVRYVSGHSMS
jgi:hypothetical protein